MGGFYFHVGVDNINYRASGSTIFIINFSDFSDAYKVEIDNRNITIKITKDPYNTKSFIDNLIMRNSSIILYNNKNSNSLGKFYISQYEFYEVEDGYFKMKLVLDDGFHYSNIPEENLYIGIQNQMGFIISLGNIKIPVSELP